MPWPECDIINMDVEQSYQLGIVEPVSGPMPPPPESFLRWLSRENKRERLLMEGYAEFEAKDRPNREIVLADAQAAMETWFEEGVEYDERLVDEVFQVGALALGIKIYTNEPPRLRSLLEAAAGQITISILTYRLPHPDEWVHILFRGSAIPKEAQRATLGLEIGRDIKATHGPYLLMPLPYGPVFETENMEPEKRAKMISNRWYELQASRLYSYVSDILARERWQWGPDPWHGNYNRKYEKRDEEAQKLEALRLTPLEKLLVYARRNRYEYGEIAKALRDTLGITKSEKALNMEHSRTEKILIEHGIIKKRF